MEYKNNIRNMSIVTQRGQMDIEVFGSMLSKKCERLATAIYLVTNFLSDNEPMKSRLRTISLDFVRDALLFKRGGGAVEANTLDILRENISETLSLLELAFIAGLVSEMNFTILKREYVSLRDTVDIKKASRESRADNIFSNNFFGSVDTSTKATSNFASRMQNNVATKMSDMNTKGHTHNGIEQSSHTTTLYPANKRTHQGQSVSTIATPQTSASRTATDIQKSSRRTRILKLIKDSNEVSIKDIVAHFPDISEKTIQRELVAMSDSGVLKKFGERRWSRYAIAK